ncbi:MAG: MarR family transcriptional regulator [Bryobacteraceae bacterium]
MRAPASPAGIEERAMTSRLQTEIGQAKPFRTLEAETVLNIVRTADALLRDLDGLLKPHGLTSTQYNLLRILRGAGEVGATCSEIRERTVKEDPDITRLLDRMEKRGLIERSRGTKDRRLVSTTITKQGLAMLKGLDAPVDALHARELEGFSKQRLRELTADMEQIRKRLA